MFQPHTLKEKHYILIRKLLIRRTKECGSDTFKLRLCAHYVEQALALNEVAADNLRAKG